MESYAMFLDKKTRCYTDVSFPQTEMESNSSQHLRRIFFYENKLILKVYMNVAKISNTQDSL